MTTLAPKHERLLSLDFSRGLIMVLLMLESAMLYEHLHQVSENTFLETLTRQFFHHPWDGLRFWDLIQPGFMFIAGTAMAFSVTKLLAKGETRATILPKVLKRCFWLFFFGVLNYAVKRDGSLSFELWNVLTQLSVTTLIAYLIFHWRFASQIAFCIGLLLLTEGLYRFTNIPGFDEPFTNLKNFGNYMDLVLMNKINGDGWVAINVIPTAVHTVAGAMVGRVLIEKRYEIRHLLIAGALCLAAGYVLHFAHITPIIKRIATSSFTLATAGWCLLAFSFFYWWIDVKNHRRYLAFFTIVGMNSLFIYLFFEIVGARWFNGYISTITTNILSWISIEGSLAGILTSAAIFSLEWYMCYFLYRKNVLIKI